MRKKLNGVGARGIPIPEPDSLINPGNTMSMLADVVACNIPNDFGFMILVFPAGGKGESNYISNCKREDMIKVLREKADVLENNLDRRVPQ